MRRRWIKNLWRLLVIATMVGCVLTAPGCIFFGWAGHVVAGGETVTAQYKPQDRLTLVLVDDPSRQLEDPTMAGRIASSIGRELKKNKIITEFVSDVEVARVATRQGEKFAAMPLDQLGRAVGASWVVTGGYQRIGNQLRITARLVESAEGTVARTTKVDGTFDEIFALQASRQQFWPVIDGFS